MRFAEKMDKNRSIFWNYRGFSDNERRIFNILQFIKNVRAEYAENLKVLIFRKTSITGSSKEKL